MIDWAGGDLESMFALRVKQLDCALTGEDLQRASKLSEEYLACARDAEVATFTVTRNVGHFIGPRGANIRNLQKQTNTLVYGFGRRGDNKFMVYYRREVDKEKVLQRAR
ncbi:unnamed protein product [Amoebophrya sp. A25]|nr:unnamed protein product [Amoebophrya sp. A25]|eukprot:GSA25T00027016001.1